MHTCSRSATGEGIFVFGTQESILITHTLETVIHNLAKKKNSKVASERGRVRKKRGRREGKRDREREPTTSMTRVVDDNIYVSLANTVPAFKLVKVKMYILYCKHIILRITTSELLLYHLPPTTQN